MNIHSTPDTEFAGNFTTSPATDPDRYRSF